MTYEIECLAYNIILDTTMHQLINRVHEDTQLRNCELYYDRLGSKSFTKSFVMHSLQGS